MLNMKYYPAKYMALSSGLLQIARNAQQAAKDAGYTGLPVKTTSEKIIVNIGVLS